MKKFCPYTKFDTQYKIALEKNIKSDTQYNIILKRNFVVMLHFSSET